MAEPEKRPREACAPEEVDAARSDFGKYRHGEKATPYGSTKERKTRPKVDPKHNYGGRTERPDPDVNDAPHVEEDDRAVRRTASAGAVYSSPLPARAFDGGDLFSDRADARAAQERAENVSFWRALLARLVSRRDTTRL